MVFRDQKLTCQECGQVFFFTVTEQRRMVRETDSEEPEPPALCPNCRAKKAGQPAMAERVPIERPVPEPRPQPERSWSEPRPQSERPRPEPRPQPERPRPEPRPQPERSRPEPRSQPVRSPSAEGQQASEMFPLEEEGIEVKLIGTVKWFSREKGYGFVTKADGQELFFHRTDMSKEEHTLPQEGQQIEFQIRQTDKGPEAFNVSILPED